MQDAQFAGAASTVAPDAGVEVAAHAQVKLAGTAKGIGGIEVGIARGVDGNEFVFRPFVGGFGIAIGCGPEKANRKGGDRLGQYPVAGVHSRKGEGCFVVYRFAFAGCIACECAPQVDRWVFQAAGPGAELRAEVGLSVVSLGKCQGVAVV